MTGPLTVSVTLTAETAAFTSAIDEARATFDALAAAAESSATRQTAALAAVEQAALRAATQIRQLESAYGAMAAAAQRSAERQDSALGRLVEALDRVQSHARDAAAALDTVAAAQGAAPQGLLQALSLFAGGGVMTADGPLPLRTYDRGGVATGPQVAVYGEGRTPEAYVPLPDGRTIPVTLSLADGGSAPGGRARADGGRMQSPGGDTYSIVAHIHGVTDPERLLDDLVTVARRRSARGQASFPVTDGPRTR